MKKIIFSIACTLLLPVCAFGSTTYVYLTSASGSWIVPSDWSPSNSIEVIGGGGGGSGGNGIDYVQWWAFGSGGGGGGGGYAKISNITTSPGSAFYYSVGATGAAGPWSGNGGTGGDSFFCSSNSSCSSISGSSVIVGAKGGSPGTVATGCGNALGGAGGQASAAVMTGGGSVAYSGGTGGNEPYYAGCNGIWVGGAGGGGAGGPHGNGGSGTPGAGGGGGGGTSGGSYVTSDPAYLPRALAAMGGNNFSGSGGGAGWTDSAPNGDAGQSGGGGGFGRPALSTSGSGAAGPGGAGTEWDTSHGSGGGGGGGPGWNQMPGAEGGSYGGGGGGGGAYSGSGFNGGSSGGAGAPGIIVITYTNLAPNAPTVSGSQSDIVGVPYTYTFTASDPENDTVKYAIDWDNNSVVDEWLPTTGYVASGVSKQTGHTFGAIGTKTFKARAEDSHGNVSNWSSYTVTVSLPAAPSATLSVNSGTHYTNSPLTLTATFSTSTGDLLVEDNIDAAVGNPSGSSGGLGNTTNPDLTKVVIFTPTAAGTYTFYARARSSAHPSWNTYQTLSVDVVNPCTPTYTCTDATHVHNSCTGADTACASGLICSSGSNICVSPPAPSFTSSSDIITGHLQAIPSIIRAGESTTIHWNISNVSSCSVTGSNDESWSGTSGSKTSSVIYVQTIYTLSCTGYNNSHISETATVYILPGFQEL